MRMNNQTQPTLLAIKIINGAMMFSQLIFVFVAFMVSQGSDIQMQFKLREGTQTIVMIFGMIAGMQSLMVLFAPKFLKRSTNQQVAPKQNLSPEDLLNSEPASSLFFDFSSFDQYIYTTTIIRLALAESIGILGFVIAVLNKAVPLMLPFTLLSLSLQFVVGPFKSRR